MRRLFTLVALLLVGTTYAADGKKILSDRCASCHDLKGPAAQTVEGLWRRKGPDRFYAGSKYRREWLASWLVDARRIRPAGYLYFDNIKPGEKRDAVNKERLKPHMRLDKVEADAVADLLMSQKSGAGVVIEGDYQSGSVSMSFGELAFDKFNGCLACHQIEPGYGGLSGPELYTVGRRLQEDFLVSFLRSPQAWNPKSLMPNRHVNEPNIQKLIRYLVGLSKEDWDEKN